MDQLSSGNQNQNGQSVLSSNHQTKKIPEVRKEVTVNATDIERYNILDTLEEIISCWVKRRRTLAYVKKFICRLREKIKRRSSSDNTDQEYPCVLNVADIQDAEIIIIKLHQRRYFKDENSILIRMRNGEEVTIQTSSKISNLDPFIDENEVLRVGGRIKRSNLNTEYFHPILLSGECIVTNLLVKWYHQSVDHGGRGYTLNKIRSSGYWIVKANSVVDVLDADIYVERLEYRR